MAEQLSIELTAKIDNFRDNFRAAVKEINTSDKEIRSKLSSIDKGFVDLANHVERSLGGKVAGTVKSASNSVSKDLAKVAQSAASSGQAMSKSATNYLNFGRIIQDLPFGLIGIQNNLTQLIPSVGAWGLAFTALTTALTFAQTGLSNWTRGLDGNEAATKKAKKSTDEYAESITGVTKAELEGAKSAQEDLSKLRLLFKAYQDSNLTLENRKLAYRQLQQEYPEYFKNLRFEQVASDKTRQIYDSLAESILKTARARAAMSLIEENSKSIVSSEAQILAIQKQKIDLVNQETASIEKRVAAQNKSYTSQQKAFLISKEAKQDQIDQIKNLDKVKKLDDQIFDIAKGRNELRKQNESLEGFVRGKQGEGVTLVDLDNADKASTKIKSLSDILKDLAKGLELTEVQMHSTFGERNEAQIKVYQSAIDSATRSFGAQSKAVQDLIAAQQKLFQLPSIKTGSALIGVLPDKNTDKVNMKREDTGFGANLSDASNELTIEYAKILDKQNKFNEEFKKGFENLQSASIAEAIGGGFSAIGEAMVSGGNIIEAAGSALMGTLSQFLNELGGMLVKKGLATVLAGTALNFLFPGQGAKTTAGGFALIAAGAALSLGSGVISGIGGKGSNSTNNNSNVTAFANGGIISGPTLGLMGEYSGAKTNPEVVAPLNKLKSMLGDNTPHFEVIQYIENDKLAVMVRNANKRLNRI